MSDNPVYRVVFVNNGNTYEIFAENVEQGALYGFVEVQGLLFNNRSGILVDPSEEKLKAEFEGVSKTQIPHHSIVRIDQVEKQGVCKITDSTGGVVTPFPMPISPDKG
ncbi:MAG: DUF1820 family protein [Kangiellaceae bacterium]|nr:DUF1820 family protein [Kangiellaceae bacterium]